MNSQDHLQKGNPGLEHGNKSLAINERESERLFIDHLCYFLDISVGQSADRTRVITEFGRYA